MPFCKTVNPNLPKGADVITFIEVKSFDILWTEVLCEVDGLYSYTSSQNLEFTSATSTHGLFSNALQMNILLGSCGQVLQDGLWYIL